MFAFLSSSGAYIWCHRVYYFNWYLVCWLCPCWTAFGSGLCHGFVFIITSSKIYCKWYERSFNHLSPSLSSDTFWTFAAAIPWWKCSGPACTYYKGAIGVSMYHYYHYMFLKSCHLCHHKSTLKFCIAGAWHTNSRGSTLHEPQLQWL